MLPQCRGKFKCIKKWCLMVVRKFFWPIYAKCGTTGAEKTLVRISAFLWLALLTIHARSAGKIIGLLSSKMLENKCSQKLFLDRSFKLIYSLRMKFLSFFNLNSEGSGIKTFGKRQTNMSISLKTECA
uniref:Secreted protein n=1 Tax=Romanomermis culicivorax TaxID=13658 RepID=A0A915IG97_ROMCU